MRDKLDNKMENLLNKLFGKSKQDIIIEDLISRIKQLECDVSYFYDVDKSHLIRGNGKSEKED